MKKILILLIMISLLFLQSAQCNEQQSLNSFMINIDDIPQGSQKSSSTGGSGLSDGVVTAIALGSTFGGLGILSGIGYYLYKNAKGLKAGLICGQKCPHQIIDSKSFCQLLGKKREYTYLMKASKKSKANSSYYYLVIPDTEIEPKHFNTLYFELPKLNGSVLNFRIIQASKAYKLDDKIPNLDSNIYINLKGKDVKKLSTYTTEMNAQNGYLLKQGSINITNDNIANITIENKENKNSQIYAIIVEFWQ